jgi:hypothetical protein
MQEFLHASWPVLAIIFVLSASLTMFSKQIADFLFAPKPGGHPLVQVFKLLAYMMTWIFLPIASAVVALISLFALIGAFA